jgi:hypothetical protein
LSETIVASPARDSSYSRSGSAPIVAVPPKADNRSSRGAVRRATPVNVFRRLLMQTSTTTSTNDVISSERVEGTAVYNVEGDKLGSIDDLMIDKVSGQVRYAVLEFGGFLGMGTDRYPLPWNMLKYDTSKDGYVVPLDKARLEGAPHYAEADRPEYDTDYGRRVNTYYGVDW